MTRILFEQLQGKTLESSDFNLITALFPRLKKYLAPITSQSVPVEIKTSTTILNPEKYFNNIALSDSGQVLAIDDGGFITQIKMGEKTKNIWDITKKSAKPIKHLVVIDSAKPVQIQFFSAINNLPLTEAIKSIDLTKNVTLTNSNLTQAAVRYSETDYGCVHHGIQNLKELINNSLLPRATLKLNGSAIWSKEFTSKTKLTLTKKGQHQEIELSNPRGKWKLLYPEMKCLEIESTLSNVRSMTYEAINGLK